MARVLAFNWWTLAIRGIGAIISGLIAFCMPAITLFALTILFGAYALIDWIVSLAAAVRAGRHGEHWWKLVFEGIVGLGVAAVSMIWPAVTLVVLIYIIAGWAIITGITCIIEIM